MEVTKDLRGRLCHNANISFEVWKERVDRAMPRLVDTLLSEAGNQEVGDAFLQFDSETQAEYVRAYFADAGLQTRLFPIHGQIGLYLRWSERPSGVENQTGKVALTVDEFWQFDRIGHGPAKSALARLAEFEEEVRADRFRANNP